MQGPAIWGRLQASFDSIGQLPHILLTLEFSFQRDGNLDECKDVLTGQSIFGCLRPVDNLTFKVLLLEY